MKTNREWIRAQKQGELARMDSLRKGQRFMPMEGPEAVYHHSMWEEP